MFGEVKKQHDKQLEQMRIIVNKQAQATVHIATQTGHEARVMHSWLQLECRSCSQPFEDHFGPWPPHH
eukprot:12917840-Prorocentrum_lima.AAC.1